MYKDIGKTDEELWRGNAGDFQLRAKKSRQITAAEIDRALDSACHPVSCEVVVLERFEHLFDDPQQFSDCALKRCLEIAENNDPQLYTLVAAAIKRKCFDARVRPGTMLEALFNYLRNPGFGTSHVVPTWNTIAKHGWGHGTELQPDFDVTPFNDLIARLKAID